MRFFIELARISAHTHTHEHTHIEEQGNNATGNVEMGNGKRENAAKAAEETRG